MNQAYFHLLVNHLPIVGLAIGLGVLVFGLIFKKSDVQLTALGIFVFASVAAFVSDKTGEAAEDIVENYAGVTEYYIHEHEESAELFMVFVMILGVVSLLGLFLSIKKSKYAKYLVLLSLVLALVSFVFSINVGKTGGEIRRPELQQEASTVAEPDED